MTIEVLKEMLYKLQIRSERIYNEGGSDYLKGFLAGEMHILTLILQKGISENIIEDYKGCSDICCINLQEGGK